MLDPRECDMVWSDEATEKLVAAYRRRLSDDPEELTASGAGSSGGTWSRCSMTTTGSCSWSGTMPDDLGHPAAARLLRRVNRAGDWCIPCGVPYMFPNRIMMKRFLVAVRILLGHPPRGVRVDDTLSLEDDRASELDHSRTPPFELVFSDRVGDGPPAFVSAKGPVPGCCVSRSERLRPGRPAVPLARPGAGGRRQVVSPHEHARVASGSDA